MNKIYNIILVKYFKEKLDNVFIRICDNPLPKKSFIRNYQYINIKHFTDKKKFDLDSEIIKHGYLIAYTEYDNKLYTFSKKEFKTMVKIIKAFCNNSYYHFNIGYIRYSIVGGNIREKQNNKTCKLIIYELPMLLQFFNEVFIRRRNITIVPIELTTVN